MTVAFDDLKWALGEKKAASDLHHKIEPADAADEKPAASAGSGGLPRNFTEIV